MTVAQLIAELRTMDQDTEVVVCDWDNEYDVVLTHGTDENLNPCAVIDLTCDCARG